MGIVKQIYLGATRDVALPFVYALLKSKLHDAYSKVFEVILSEAEHLGVQRFSETIMSDFELGIINAAQNEIGDFVKVCLFHLCQSDYR